MKTWTFTLTRGIRRSCSFLILPHATHSAQLCLVHRLDGALAVACNAHRGACWASNARQPLAAGSLAVPHKLFPPVRSSQVWAQLPWTQDGKCSWQETGWNATRWLANRVLADPCRAASLHSTRDTAAPKKNLPLLCLAQNADSSIPPEPTGTRPSLKLVSRILRGGLEIRSVSGLLASLPLSPL